MAVVADQVVESPNNQPSVISAQVEDSRAELVLLVDADLGCFVGHFPGYPILPGVVQIDWAVACARDYLGLVNPVKTLDRLKFTNPIQPGIRLHLTLEMDPSRSFANFLYHNDELVFAVGRLHYV